MKLKVLIKVLTQLSHSQSLILIPKTFPVIILILAAAFDLLFGELPVSIHPVVLFGKTIEKLSKTNRGNCYLRLISGFLTFLVVTFIAFVISKTPFVLYVLLYVLLHTTPKLNLNSNLNSIKIAYIGYVFLSSILLKSCFSIRSMIEHVKKAIQSNFSVNTVQMLVSRDVKRLNYNQRCSAVIESIAENYVDGLLSPLIFYAFFGLSGAMIYKAVNTCDSMIGYKNKEFECYGKVCAKIDDILNYFPARLSILIFSLVNKRALKAFKFKVKGRINACPIVAIAYALNLRLEKPGKYIINYKGKNPEKEDVIKTLKIFKMISILTILLILLLCQIRFFTTILSSL